MTQKYNKIISYVGGGKKKMGKKKEKGKPMCANPAPKSKQ